MEYRQSHSNGLDNYPVPTSKQAFPLKEAIPIGIGIILAVIGSLVAAGFIQKPATQASVNELKDTITTYILHHDKIHLMNDERTKTQLGDLQRAIETLTDHLLPRPFNPPPLPSPEAQLPATPKKKLRTPSLQVIPLDRN